jgi:hypothetical protein
VIGQVLSRLLWDAREQVSMLADIVNGRGHDAKWQHDYIAEVDAFRGLRGWSPDGFGRPNEGGIEVDGVEYTREAVEDVRQLVIELRGGALDAGRMDYAAGLSHAIVYLAELAEVMPKRSV